MHGFGTGQYLFQFHFGIKVPVELGNAILGEAANEGKFFLFRFLGTEFAVFEFFRLFQVK
jgi:hypothetical protein